MAENVEDILARLKASADVARQRTADAAEVARGRPRIQDPGDSLGIPAPDSEPYDFEKKPELDDHGFEPEMDLHDDPNLAETRVAPESTATERLAAAREDATRVLSDEQTAATLKMKAQSRAHPTAENPVPAKSIEQLAQEDAERILGRKPMTPPEVGTMEGKPVASETIKVPDELVPAKPEPTPEGKILSTAEDAAHINAPEAIPDISDAELHAAIREIQDPTVGAIKRSIPNAAQRLSGRLAARTTREGFDAVRSNMSLGEKVAARAPRTVGALGSVGKFAGTLAKETGKELIAPLTGAYKGFTEGGAGFREAGAIGKAWRGGKALAGGAFGLAKGGGKLAAEGFILPAIIGGEGNMISDKLTYGSDSDYGKPAENPGLLGARDQQIQNLKDYNADANNYGLKVTGRTNPLAMLAYGGPQIKVSEDPGLKAAYIARNHERIQAMQNGQPVNQH